MLLVSPLGWIYYFPFLLLPFLLLWKGAGLLEDGANFRWLAVLAWVLSSVFRSHLVPEQFGGDPVLILWWSGTYFYALVLFVLLIWTMQGRSARPSPSPVEP
jgi:hypothetical protein